MLTITSSMIQRKGFNTTIPPYYSPPKITYNKKAQIDIYTDGSKTSNGTGYAFCTIKNNIIIKVHQIQLHNANSIYQAELLAIKDAIGWFKQSPYSSTNIITDNQSSTMALKDGSTKDQIIIDILKSLQKNKKEISISWTKSHIGTIGNEIADTLAKRAANSIYNIPKLFHPIPPSYIKRKLTKEALEKWQTSWDEDTKGRFTYNLIKKVKEETLLTHRNLYIFATNHGPFPEYLFKINKCPSDSCVCGEIGNSLHYQTKCILTRKFHIKKPNAISDDNWFNLIVNTSYLKDKIIKLIAYIEENEKDLQGS